MMMMMMMMMMMIMMAMVVVMVMSIAPLLPIAQSSSFAGPAFGALTGGVTVVSCQGLRRAGALRGRFADPQAALQPLQGTRAVSDHPLGPGRHFTA
jgi:hypothetical protein